MMTRISRRAALGGAVGAFAALRAGSAMAADRLRVGKAVAENFGFIPVDIGVHAGLFKKHGLEIEEVNFTGGAKIAQAITAGALDISLSGGPDMAFVAKGAPEIAIGSITESPAFMGYCVGNDSTAKSLDDLRGTKIGITSPGSLTAWLVDELNRVKGWSGADRATSVVIGGSTAADIAALKTHEVDASISATQTGFLLEEQKAGRLLSDCSPYIDRIEIFTTFASNAILARNPEAVRRFLAAWYESVAYMKAHKAETVSVGAKVMNYPVPVTARSYDSMMKDFSFDGRFGQKALATLAGSFEELKVVNGPVQIAKLYTEKFLPKGGAA